MNHKQLLVTLISMILFLHNGVAQDFERLFEDFKNSNKRTYRNFKEANDSIFAAHIRSNWRQFHLNEPYKKNEESAKPISQPKTTPDFVPKPIKHEVESREKPILRKYEQPSFEHIDYYPEDNYTADFEFYGAQISIKYSDKILVTGPVYNSSSQIAHFYLKCAKSPYKRVLNQLLKLKRELYLPDFAYYLLIKRFFKEVDTSNSVLYHWFYLFASDLNAKIGLSDGQPVLFIHSPTRVYNFPYIVLNGLNYYVVTKVTTAPETYSDLDEYTRRPFSFIVEEGISLPTTSTKRKISVGDQVIDLSYNKNVADLLDQLPPVEIGNYFQSGFNHDMRDKLVKQLWPLMREQTVQQRIEFLLSLVQESFPYKSDEQQFAKEKVMYPEEYLSHEFSDCDDRSVFLAYLIKLFTELETVGVTFPRHVAIGVSLPPPAYGEHFEFSGKRYTLCDPTYLGAPIGAVIPDADRDKMVVVD